VAQAGSDNLARLRARISERIHSPGILNRRPAIALRLSSAITVLVITAAHHANTVAGRFLSGLYDRHQFLKSLRTAMAGRRGLTAARPVRPPIVVRSGHPGRPCQVITKYSFDPGSCPFGEATHTPDPPPPLYQRL
jgi:hypothetical protein